MSESSKLNHHTELQSASLVSSGSGDILIGGSFVPTPIIPVNGCNLPNRHPNFVGRRDEIRKVIDALASRAWIVTIDGMGGIGKTTLALEVAHLCRERSPDYPDIPEFTGYIWTSARDKPDFCLDDVIREILYVLSPFETRTRRLDSPEQLSLAVRALAAEPRLLIIDNFETVKNEPLHRFLRDQLPDPSKVLITSRHHIQTGERVVTIGGLEEEDAIRLLRLEAARLQIPLDDRDTARLRIIAQKSHGIPLVLRWVMESVYDGKSLEWVLESLEYATAEDIFDYIFERSLSTLDPETHSIFRSMSLLPTWIRIETIAAMNPGIAAIQERVGHLVSLSLMEDNRTLIHGSRRYQLPPFARYLATKELTDTDDKGRSTVKYALKHYVDDLQSFKPHSELTDEYLKAEFINLNNVVQVASTLEDSSLLEQCTRLAATLRGLSDRNWRTLFDHLIEPIKKMGDEVLTLKLLDFVGNPYILGMPVYPPMFFGRGELLKDIQETFEGDQLHTPVVSLIGPRRIGKTSILRQLLFQTTDKCIYALFDTQLIAGGDTLELLYELANSISEAVVIARDVTVEKPRFEEFTDRPYKAFDSYIENIRSSLSPVRLVLLIDEFDLILHLGERGRVDTMSLLAHFRSMVQRGAFGMVTAGVTPLHELPSSVASSPFFNIAVSKRVSFLDRDAAIELIRQPTYGLLEYEPQAIEYLLKLSGRHPYLLQHLCSLILYLCKKGARLLVDLETVEAAALDIYEQAEFMLHDLLYKLSTVEQTIVSAAAFMVETNEDTFTVDRLAELLRRYGVELDNHQSENALDNLVRREILTVDDQENYKFTMEIFRLWLERNDHLWRALERLRGAQ